MKLERVRTASRELERVQDNVERALQPTPRNIITGVSLLSGVATPVSHRLGRAASGWSIVRKRGFADIQDLMDGNPVDKFILLVSNADVVVDVEVFA